MRAIHRACRDMRELIPHITSPATFIELFHSLLDLPLLAATLERADQYERTSACLYVRILVVASSWVFVCVCVCIID